MVRQAQVLSYFPLLLLPAFFKTQFFIITPLDLNDFPKRLKETKVLLFYLAIPAICQLVTSSEN